MQTSVKTLTNVTITATLEEWLEKLAKPDALVIEIENVVLAASVSDVGANGHRKPETAKSPKGKTARGAGKAGRRNFKKTGTTYDCPSCRKGFAKESWLQKHIERVHGKAVLPAGD